MALQMEIGRGLKGKREMQVLVGKPFAKKAKTEGCGAGKKIKWVAMFSTISCKNGQIWAKNSSKSGQKCKKLVVKADKSVFD